MRARTTEALLNKPVQSQKVPFGVDPKTVLCQYYKAGFCEKAAKVSHQSTPLYSVRLRSGYARSD